MAKSVNRCIFVGNVGKQPEVKYTPSGTAVATFSIACNEKFKSGNDWQERTEWVNIKVWAKLAEIIEKYVNKGDRIYVEGRLNTESWDDKNSGEKRYRTVVVANDIVLLGGKGEGGARSEEEPAHAQQVSDEDVPF